MFSRFDYSLTPQWVLSAGLRYTREEKQVKIATVAPGPASDAPQQVPNGACDVIADRCAFNFVDAEDWANVIPKLGLQWLPDDRLQLYAFITKGFRSGGYNLRSTSTTASPGPFDEEEQRSAEIGFKYDTPERTARINAALFYNKIDNMQREVNLPDATSGVVQIIRNTADTTIWGAELEGHVFLLDSLLLSATVGYTEGEYDRVKFDLNGDGNVDDLDKQLDLPRLVPLTGSLALSYERPLADFGTFATQLSYSHREPAAYTDNNLGRLNGANIVDANISISPSREHWTLSLYGKNLRNEVTEGGDTRLPDVLGGGSFSPLNKGRVLGVELQYRYR